MASTILTPCYQKATNFIKKYGDKKIKKSHEAETEAQTETPDASELGRTFRLTPP